MTFQSYDQLLGVLSRKRLKRSTLDYVGAAASKTHKPRNIAAKRKRGQQKAQEREQTDLQAALERGRQADELQRQTRLRKGVMGLIDRITGRRAKTIAKNNREKAHAIGKDMEETLALALHHQRQREKAEAAAPPSREAFKQSRRTRSIDTGPALSANSPENLETREDFKEKRRQSSRPKRRSRNQSRDGPDYGL